MMVEKQQGNKIQDTSHLIIFSLKRIIIIYIYTLFKGIVQFINTHLMFLI